MKIPYLKKRHKTYWYCRHVPKTLQHRYGTGTYSVSLRTHDIKVAVTETNRINNEWVQALSAESDPNAAYQQALKQADKHQEAINQVNSKWADDLNAPSQRITDHYDNEEIERVLTTGSLEERAYFNAAFLRESGRPIDDEFVYSLRTGLRGLKEYKQSDITPKSLKRYDNAVDRFLQNKKDIPLAHIKKQNVRTWVDSLRTQVSQKTRTDFLSTLGLIFEHALERGHIQDDLVNPFRGIKHSDKKKKRSFIPWTDDVLRKILNNHRLSNCDRIVSLIGRYSGMRQSEIFNCTLVTKDGVPCLSIAPTETYAGGKTPAAQRLVPIRASILDAVRRTFGQWGSQSSFSKRFSAAKTELVGPGYPDRAFHSLRPQFITLAANAGYSTEQIAWLVGHDGDKGLAMTGGLYMKGYSIELLRDLVEAVPELEGVTTS